MQSGKVITMEGDVSIVQPTVPHYREAFFSGMSQLLNPHGVHLFSYIKDAKSRKSGFSIGRKTDYLPNVNVGGVLLYDPTPLLKREVRCLVLMFHFAHITTWLLLLTKCFHHKKIILWGHGISIKRYVKEERKLDWKLKWMASFSDGIWFYTERELQLWRRQFPSKHMVALGNTISNVGGILSQQPPSKSELRQKYSIGQSVVLIYCARFETIYRRVDLLLDVIESLDADKYGFVIIGDGRYKPDFSKHNNVYDFGAVYDQHMKDELFGLSDIYFQPGWVGLSIVEAMAYGKPIFTFKRTESVKQCVEYSYIIDDYNGKIFADVAACLSTLRTLNAEDIDRMSHNATDYVRNNLTMDSMVQTAVSSVEAVCAKAFT